MPAEIDEATRQLTRLQIEAAALAQESSADSKTRLNELRRQIADREESVNALKARWQNREGRTDIDRPLKKRLNSFTRLTIRRSRKHVTPIPMTTS